MPKVIIAEIQRGDLTKKKCNKNLEELKMDSVPGQDSGVETEGSGIEPDQESNDSSLSSVSFRYHSYITYITYL